MKVPWPSAPGMNARYKLLHDARKRIKKEFEKRGISPEEIFAQ